MISIRAAVEHDLIKKYPHFQRQILDASREVEKKYLPWFAKELNDNPGKPAIFFYDYIQEFKNYSNLLPSPDIYSYTLDSLQKAVSEIKVQKDKASQLAQEYFNLLKDKRDKHSKITTREKARELAYKEALQWLSEITPVTLRVLTRKEISRTIRERHLDGGIKNPRQLAYKHSDVIFEDERFLVVHPGTKQASQYFGQGTQWCTAAQNDNYFVGYSLRNVFLYYIIDKSNQSSDNKLRKIAYALAKVGDNNEMEIFNALDQSISESEVEKYLDEHATPVLSAIKSNLAQRDDNKFNESLSQVSSAEEVDIISTEIDNKEQKTSTLVKMLNSSSNAEVRKHIITLLRPAAENWAKNGYTAFFSYKLHEVPEFKDLIRKIAEKWAQERNMSFFDYKLHEIPEFKDLTRKVAETWAQEGNPNFFNYELHKMPEFKDLARKIAEEWAQREHSYFFRYGIHEIPEFKDRARKIAEEWAQTNSYAFFDYGLHEVPEFKDLARKIAEGWAQEERPHFFHCGLHKMPEFGDLAGKIAEEWAQDRSSYFFACWLHKMPEFENLTRKIAETWAQEGNPKFFGYELHKMPEFKDLARKIAETWAQEGNPNFFGYKLHKMPEFKDLIRKIAEGWAQEGNPNFFNYELHEVPEFKNLARKIAETWAQEGNPSFFNYELHKMPEFENLVGKKDLVQNAAQKISIRAAVETPSAGGNIGVSTTVRRYWREYFSSVPAMDGTNDQVNYMIALDYASAKPVHRFVLKSNEPAEIRKSSKFYYLAVIRAADRKHDIIFVHSHIAEPPEWLKNYRMTDDWLEKVHSGHFRQRRRV